MSSDAPLVVWLITDGKPGHRNQLEGLRLALTRATAVRSCWLDAPAPSAALAAWMRGRFVAGDNLPAPDLIVVAGHRTHLAGLAARRAHGGRLVVLMRPSLPGWLFDACVVPLHDRPPRSGRVLRTLGVLNPMRPGEKRSGTAVVLIGGTSRHFTWQDDEILTALDALQQHWPEALVTDSRRTPPSLRRELAQRFGDRYHPWEDCVPGWLADTLAQSETAWVTADSVSMIYEALSAGCATGLIELRPADAGGRHKIARGLAALLADGRIVGLCKLLDDGQRPTAPTEPLAEADAIAARLLDAPRLSSRRTPDAQHP